MKRIAVDIIKAIMALTKSKAIVWSSGVNFSSIFYTSDFLPGWKISFFEHYNLDVSIYLQGEGIVFCRNSLINIELFRAIQEQRGLELPECAQGYIDKISCGELLPEIRVAERKGVPFLLEMLLLTLPQYQSLRVAEIKFFTQNPI